MAHSALSKAQDDEAAALAERSRAAADLSALEGAVAPAKEADEQAGKARESRAGNLMVLVWFLLWAGVSFALYFDYSFHHWVALKVLGSRSDPAGAKLSKTAPIPLNDAGVWVSSILTSMIASIFAIGPIYALVQRSLAKPSAEAAATQRRDEAKRRQEAAAVAVTNTGSRRAARVVAEARLDWDLAQGELDSIRLAAANVLPDIAGQIARLTAEGYSGPDPPASLLVRIGTTGDALQLPAGIDVLSPPTTLVFADDPEGAASVLLAVALGAATAAPPSGIEIRLVDLATRGQTFAQLRGLPNLGGTRLAFDAKSAGLLTDEIRTIIAERNDALVTHGHPSGGFTPVLVVYHGLHGFGISLDDASGAWLWDVMKVGGQVRVYLAASVEAGAHPTDTVSALAARGSYVIAGLERPSERGTGRPRAGTQRAASAVQLPAGLASRPATTSVALLSGEPALVHLDPHPDGALLERATAAIEVAVRRWDPGRLSISQWVAGKAGQTAWPPQGSLKVIVGATLAGAPVQVDIGSGHVIVAGGHWSGKSSIVRSMAVQSASQNHAASLRLVLLDLDQGGDLVELAELPHAHAYATEPVQAARVLGRLRRELEKRIAGTEPSSTYMVVLEGLNRLPDAELLEPIAYRGAERGIHLLATLRPGSRLTLPLRFFPWRIVSDAVNASEAVEEMDMEASVRLEPGDALIRGPRRRAVAMRPEFLSPQQLRQLVDGNIEIGERAKPPIRTRVVASTSPPSEAPLVVPPALFAETPGRLAVPAGLGPGATPVVLDAADPGQLAVVGGSPAERAGCVRNLVLGLAARYRPDGLALYLADGTGDELNPVIDLPHVVAHSRDPGADMLRCLQTVNEEIDRRKDLFGKAPGWAEFDAGQPGQVPQAVVVVHDLASATLGANEVRVASALTRILLLGPAAGIGVIASIADRRQLARDYRLHQIGWIELTGRQADDEEWTPGLATVGIVDRDLTPAGDAGAVRLVLAGSAESVALADRITSEAAARGFRGPEAVRYVELPEFVAFEDLFTGPDGQLACCWEPPPEGLRVRLGVTKRSHPLVINFSERAVDQTSTVHTFLAGTTGAGKTATLHALILSLAFTYSPQDVRVVVLDMKGGGDFLTLTDLPHLLHVSTDPVDAHSTLTRLAAEYQRRVDRFRDLARPGVPMTNISDYREAGHEDFPSLVVVIDEPATLRADRQVGADSFRIIEDICRRGRAAGIHLVLTTLEPDPSVLTPVIKANVRGRIALQMASATQSAILLGTEDAIQLRGRGHGIYQIQEDTATREYFQAAYADLRHWPAFQAAFDEATKTAGRPVPFDLPPHETDADTARKAGPAYDHLGEANARLQRAEAILQEAAEKPRKGKERT